MPSRTVLRRALGVALGYCLGAAALASAQTSFSVTGHLDASGAARRLYGGVIKASNGLLYGTAYESGVAPQCGGIYKVASDGTVTVIHAFDGPDGCHPVGELVQGTDGHLYGTTWTGGPYADATLTGGTGTINDAGVVNPARVYVGVAAPFGVYWLRPTGFSTVQGTLYSGPLPAIPPTALFTLPNAAAWPAGTYYWFMLVDTDGPGDAFNYVQVAIAP